MRCICSCPIFFGKIGAKWLKIKHADADHCRRLIDTIGILNLLSSLSGGLFISLSLPMAIHLLCMRNVIDELPFALLLPRGSWFFVLGTANEHKSKVWEMSIRLPAVVIESLFWMQSKWKRNEWDNERHWINIFANKMPFQLKNLFEFLSLPRIFLSSVVFVLAVVFVFVSKPKLLLPLLLLPFGRLRK